MLAVGSSRSVDLYRPEGSETGHMHFMIYSCGEPLALSEALPLLEDMGVDVYTEHPYELKLRSGDAFWIQDFHLRHESGTELDVEAIARRFEDCFMAVLSGSAENDGLNRLILSARLDWRQTAVLRCYSKYLQQLRIPFSQTYMEDVLVSHARFVRLLVQQFELQFNPRVSSAKRQKEMASLQAAVSRELMKAKNVDEDRILSALSGAIGATLRTNYYLRNADQEPYSYLSIKLDPSQLPEVPLPPPQI